MGHLVALRAVLTRSTIIDVVVGSAYEAEVGATFINGQRAEPVDPVDTEAYTRKLPLQ